MLNLENLKGIFVAMPIAMNAEGAFVEDDYRHDIRKMAGTGVHGLYTTGSTGEWYALDNKEFEWMVDLFLEETSKFNILTQIGCGGLDTRQTIRRIKIVTRRECKPDGIQVLLPPWQVLTDDEVMDFFKAVSDACEGLPIIHYNTIRSKRFLTEREYEKILNSVPCLIGSKSILSNIEQMICLLRAELPMNHFVGHEWNAVLASVWGSKGIYSDYALYWPEACVRLFALCEQKRWDEAFALQEKFLNFCLEGEGPLIDRGYSDASWDKGKTEAAGILRCKRFVRRPYHCMKEEDILHFRKVGEKYF